MPRILSNRDLMKARVMACYCAQLVEDACNADLSIEVRETLTGFDLVMAGALQAFYEDISGVSV